MNIRPKVMVVLTLLVLVLSGMAIFIQESVVLPKFAQLEQRNAQIAMNRVRNSVEHDLETMEVQALDTGNWGELYEFARGNYAQFPERNFTPAAMRAGNVNAVWVIGLDGRVISSSEEVLNSGFGLEGIVSHGGALREDFPWRANLGAIHPFSGLVSTSQGLMLLASSPILNGTGNGPPVGRYLIGRLLTPAMVRRIEAQTETAITPQALPENGVQDRLIETAGVTQVFGSFRDIYGQPAMTLRVDVPREITAYGRGALQVASASIVAASIVVLVLMLVLLNRLVLAPLTRVTRHAVAIGEDPGRSERLNFRTHDEFGLLAAEFDRMVDRFAQTRSELVDHSFQAGFAELSKGVLHNLGNALTPLGVRLDSLSRRLRESPAEDVQRAAVELVRTSADAGRRAELLEFIELGAREMATMVSDASADLETMQRQASLMRASLSEQMRVSANRGAVLESVRLPELIAQSLEIVPDVSRRRLSVETDESLQKIGTVRVARTVLRMVLQNLIINAADAVRDAGKDKGVFRVAAEIFMEADKRQLHLSCADDGVGIPQEQLERVFEKGFSTKSRDTNHGIGLHWCANAVLALGGRIWAASEGPGRGAALHLVLPLGAQESGSTA
ncbi:MAG: CHASE4 domain-containing protein [Steroidobacterales bacterium]